MFMSKHAVWHYDIMLKILACVYIYLFICNLFSAAVGDTFLYLTLEGPCIIFCNIYIHSNEIHNVVALVKCLLVLRYQFFLKRCTSRTYQIVRFLPRTIVCTYSIYKEAPEDGPLRSETCRADTRVLINA